MCIKSVGYLPKELPPRTMITPKYYPRSNPAKDEVSN